MGKSIEKTMLPLTICSTASGFYTLQIKKTNLKYIAIAYCCLLAIFFSTKIVPFTVSKFHALQFNFYTVSSVLAELVQGTMLTYYCIKFIAQAGAVTDVLARINYADRRLERIGVGAARGREQTLCAAYTILNIFVSTVRSVILHPFFKRASRKLTISKVYSVYYVTVSPVLIHSSEMLLIHFVYLLYTVKQRVSRLRYAVERIDYIFARRNAWDNTRRDISASRQEYYLIEIQEIKRCLFETFLGVQKFYKHYYPLNLLLYILRMSVLLFLCATKIYPSSLIYFIERNTLLLVASVALCVNMRYEFHCVQSLINNFYWSSKVKRSIQCAHRDLVFSCGYFDVDYNFLKIAFTLLVLLSFAMIQSDI